jgi:hypothetical protein
MECIKPSLDQATKQPRVLGVSRSVRLDLVDDDGSAVSITLSEDEAVALQTTLGECLA